MRVRICYTVDVDDNYRKALRYRYGEKGKATREEIKEHYEIFGGTVDDDILCEYDNRAHT